MVRFNIQVNYGDANITKRFYFVHQDWQKLSEEEQSKAFDMAVKELNRVYKMYGRFATQVGITRLFESFGFMASIP